MVEFSLADRSYFQSTTETAEPVILCMTLQALWDLGRLFEFLVVLMSVLGRLTESPSLKETSSDGQVVIFWLVTEMVPEVISFIYSDKEHHLTQKLD